MVFVDVPVDLDAVFLGFGIEWRQRQITGIEAPGIFGDIDDFIDLGLGDIDDVGRFGTDRTETGVAGEFISTAVFFVVGEEEQCVFQNRAADGEAIGGLCVEKIRADAGFA